MRKTLIIFVKAPIAGRVKTRLARAVGPARAAAISRCLAAQTIAETKKGEWRTILAVDPPSAIRGFSNIWPSDIDRIPQGKGDLGARMKAAFAEAPEGPAIIIGADAPAVRARHIRRAFHALAGADAVFGPSDDGGFWLVGLSRRRAAANIFNGVRWSTNFALRDSIDSLPKGFRMSFGDRLRDIDEGADLAVHGPRAFMRSLARI